jgi:hypothetical protein
MACGRNDGNEGLGLRSDAQRHVRMRAEADYAAGAVIKTEA